MAKLYILTLLLTIACPQAKRLVIHWNSFECIVNPTIVTFHKCFIVDPARSLITTEVEYNRKFEQFNASFVLLLPRPPFKDYYKAFELNMDVCKFFKGSYQNKLVKTAYTSMMKFSNMPKSCPQPKGLYYYHNMSIGDHLPNFLPKYDFKVNLDFFLPHSPIINVSLNGRLTDPPRHRAERVQSGGFKFAFTFY